MCAAVLVSAFSVMFILHKKNLQIVLHSQSNTIVFLFKGYMLRSSYQA